MNKRFLLFSAFTTFLILFFYRPWFMSGEIIGGDWPYLFPEMVRDISRAPSSWQAGQGGGLGGLSPSYFLSTYNTFFAWISVFLGVPWSIVYKALWFFSSAVLLAAGGWRLHALLFPRLPLWTRALSALIIVTNTYILMVAGGGQLGVFYAVSIVPWVLIFFLRWLAVTRNQISTHSTSQRLYMSVLLGTAFGLQVSLDPRIAYLSFIIMAVLYYFDGMGIKLSSLRISHGALAAIIGMLLNFYWVLPLILLRENTFGALGNAYTSVDALQFFSFADFSHTMAFLHPNWPENIFGKTYFLKPEFLVVPIVAFMSLFYVVRWCNDQRDRKWVWGFAAVGLLGAFLAKGANEPLGYIYVWFYEHIPGFVMFRDPTKFYVLIIISYAMLIPFTLYSIVSGAGRFRSRLVWIVPTIFLAYWLSLIHPALTGALGGTFARRSVPAQYVQLKRMLASEIGFFRTLWVPRQSRFAYSSPYQLPIESGPLLGATDAATLTGAMNTSDIQNRLDILGIRYLVVPFDPYGELFQEDNSYSAKKRLDIENVLDSLPWLTKVLSGDIALYKTRNTKDHFWLADGTVSRWDKKSDDYYEVSVDVAKPTKMMVSEAYHPGWLVHINGETIQPVLEPFGIMSFVLPRPGAYAVILEFFPRRWYVLGRIISLSTFCIVLFYILLHRTYASKTV